MRLAAGGFGSSSRAVSGTAAAPVCSHPEARVTGPSEPSGPHGESFACCLSLAPATEDEAAQSEAQAEGAEAEGADRERLADWRKPLPAAEDLLLLGGQGLAATLLPQRSAGPQAEVEVVEDLGRFVSHEFSV